MSTIILIHFIFLTDQYEEAKICVVGRSHCIFTIKIYVIGILRFGARARAIVGLNSILLIARDTLSVILFTNNIYYVGRENG